MIASLFGEITEISASSLVVRVGGVGLLVGVPAELRTRVKIGENVSLHTYLVVREDSLSLYGFDSAEEREFFVLLLSVNGIGPRTALATLSVLSPDAIRRAVVSEQADVFARVPGVGKKTGQKILLQLQGKIKDTEITGLPAAITNLDTEVLDALTGLGYSVVEAQTAIQAIPHEPSQDVETRLRLALQYFR